MRTLLAFTARRSTGNVEKGKIGVLAAKITKQF
jgi:hypothetical protein